MASWTPQQAGLEEILQTIHKSTDTNTSGVQTAITHVRCSARYSSKLELVFADLALRIMP